MVVYVSLYMSVVLVSAMLIPGVWNSLADKFHAAITVAIVGEVAWQAFNVVVTLNDSNMTSQKILLLSASSIILFAVLGLMILLSLSTTSKRR